MYPQLNLYHLTNLILVCVFRCSATKIIRRTISFTCVKRGYDMTFPERAIPPGIRRPLSRVISNNMIGDKVSFTLYSTETPEQNYFKIRCVVKPGGGVPLHYHRHCSEHFRVLRGVMTAVKGREVLSLSEGEEALIPVMTDHLFRNDSAADCEFEGTVSHLLILFELRHDMQFGTAVPPTANVNTHHRQLWSQVLIRRSCWGSSRVYTSYMDLQMTAFAMMRRNPRAWYRLQLL